MLTRTATTDCSTSSSRPGVARSAPRAGARGAGPVLFLSPHPDDVAWSLGATVSALAGARAELHVLTLFGRSRYAPGHAVHGTLAASGVRAGEEARWAELAGVRLWRRDHPDATLRGFDDDTEMGQTPEPSLVERLRDDIDAVIDAIEPRLVVAPLGVGSHVDHAAVREAALRLRKQPSLAWYEDLPYAAMREPPAVARPIVVDVERRWPAKERGIRAFASQRPDDVLPLVRAHAARVSGERIWLERVAPDRWARISDA